MNMSVDEDLRTARARLVARGAELRERVGLVGRDLRRETNPLPGDAPDAAVVIENDEVLQAIDETARRELRLIEHALERLEIGAFARCEDCGATIEAARLVAVPYASHCRRCAKDA
jgi:RNA polymerase-binding transcription factor DksA